VAQEKEIGRIIHFFDKISVGIVELSSTLKKGDKIHIKGHTTDFVLDVDSIQIDKEEVEVAKAGEVVGVKFTEEAREGDKVYLVG